MKKNKIFAIFLTFLKIGAFTFGGGYAMIPLIQQEVINEAWLSQEELIDFVAISESTPGPFAVNVSTFVGMKTAGILGAFCATLGVVLPSFVIILIVAGVFERFKKSRIVGGCMTGLKNAVIGLIATAVVTTGVSAFSITRDFRFLNIKFVLGVVLFAGMFFLLKKKVHPIFGVMKTQNSISLVRLGSHSELFK